ncbi:hypothetical protein BSL78_08203 [Apostichopus japonicus]|uniref:Uncharacterized protein n=1 Tax=Stichopus japonicus TaxID=307972 RepID=A0A2G8L448_STIJA|nr:hypothetical protein BSL78_08203 [Apostichopus japonicus]
MSEVVWKAKGVLLTTQEFTMYASVYCLDLLNSVTTMATNTPLKDLAENFFLCSVCLDQFKEPKLLPCLHRYCSDCLETVIQASRDGTVKCPMCKQQCIIPDTGVEGFKTDFHTKSMLEFIQLQKSFEKKDLKKCISCSEMQTATSYCFKCKNFLCDQCSQFHINNPMFLDHQPHILTLETMEAKSLTLEKLAALTEDPRCHIHLKQQAQLCCSTCRNIPVCVTCTYSNHKGHDLHDVADLAKKERQSLQKKLFELNKYKGRLYELPNKVNLAIRKLSNNVSKKTQNLNMQYDQEESEIKERIGKSTNERETGANDIEKRRRNEKKQIDIKREEELRKVMEKYDQIGKTTDRKYDKEFDELQRKFRQIESELLSKLESCRGYLKDLEASKELITTQNENKLKEILHHSERVIKRYENLTATTSSILSSNDEWTDAQYIPDIISACKSLIQEMKREFPELQILSDVANNDITNVTVDKVTIGKEEVSVVDVEGFVVNGWLITGMTGTEDGSIVITGRIPTLEYSYIAVFSSKGKYKRQDIFPTSRGYQLRVCSTLSKFKVVTVIGPDKIGIYDVRDGSYYERSISKVTKWPSCVVVRCIATDPINQCIIVGTSCRYVYVFNYQLKYDYTITLPDICIRSTDITVHRGHLLVADCSDSKRAFSVKMEPPENKLVYKFTKPNIDDGTWGPFGVCTDKLGFIYITWKSLYEIGNRCILLKYSQDGRQILTTRSIDSDSQCLATLESDQSEKLLVVTHSTAKLYTFELET